MMGVGTGVGNDKDLARPGYHINPNLTSQKLFGQGNVNIPWAHYQIHRRYSGGTESECCYGPCASNLKNLPNPEELRGHEEIGVDTAVLARRGHHLQTGNSGNDCGNTVHEERGDKRSFPSTPAWNIEPRCCHRREHLPEDGTVLTRHEPGIPPLGLVKGGNIFLGTLHKTTKFRINLLGSLFHL